MSSHFVKLFYRLVFASLLLLPLSACGKKGPPHPPGPPDKITYPRIYPPDD
ncbi:MAG: hypothetical protein IIT88_03035 [Acetobacter sp.]|nr:hypothetical protein [Acetobacter sp.]MBR2123823.1 hypothetical protein [Acetobacter sp.]